MRRSRHSPAIVWACGPGTFVVGIAATVAFALAGCSVVKPPERPAWRVFALEPAPIGPALDSGRGAAPRISGGPVIVVSMPESGAGYATRRMAYTRGAGELEYFATHRWADAPARMLVPLFQQALSQTGAFRAVASAPTRVVGDFVVESELLAFRQETADGDPRFHATLRVTLLRPGASGATGARVFDVVEPMAAAGPEAGVPAANRAVARILAEAAAFCAGIAADTRSQSRIPEREPN